MNILMVTERYVPIWGGAENQLRQLIPHLERCGGDVSIVTRRWHDDWDKVITIDGVKVTRLGIPGKGKWAEVIFVLALVCYMICNRNKYDIVHSHGAVYMGALCSSMSKLLGVKNIVKIASAGKITPFMKSISGKIILWLFRMADMVIAMTDEIKEELSKINFLQRKIAQITNGVDVNRFKPASESAKRDWRLQRGMEPDCKIVLFSSRLVYGKGIDLLLEAWSRLAGKLSTEHLLIVGSGENQNDSIEQELKDRVANEDIPNVIFYGATEAPEKLLGIADIFVFPSRQEGFPNALMEALATGLPVVASNIGGVKPLVANNYTGILFESENVDELCERLWESLTEIERMKKLGERAREEMGMHFSFSKIAQQYSHLYSNVLHADQHPVSVRFD